MECKIKVLPLACAKIFDTINAEPSTQHLLKVLCKRKSTGQHGVRPVELPDKILSSVYCLSMVQDEYKMNELIAGTSFLGICCGSEHHG
jgi:hypothetical protein